MTERPYVFEGTRHEAELERLRTLESGHVLAVDLNTRFLSGLAGANLEVREADIREPEIEPDSFDLAHARFVLIHVPDWKGALAAMIRCLKPGGWLVLEEPDFSSSRSLAGPAELRRAFDNVHRAIEAMFRQRGLDHAFGARLPALLLDGGLEAIAIENDASIVPGGSPLARMMGDLPRDRPGLGSQARGGGVVGAAGRHPASRARSNSTTS
jgi:SAM-dependent methyltransferase